MLRSDINKQRTSLTLDNVWDDFKSLEEGKKYLQAIFKEGSLVLVTTCSLSTLIYHGINESQCFEMQEIS